MTAFIQILIMYFAVGYDNFPIPTEVIVSAKDLFAVVAGGVIAAKAKAP